MKFLCKIFSVGRSLRSALLGRRGVENRESNRERRRGAITVMSAFFMVGALTFAAFTIDLGYIVLVRTELQVAADSAALAAASRMHLSRSELVNTATKFAAYHKAGGDIVSLASADVEYGVWDASRRRFTPTKEPGNAVRVTARAGGENRDGIDLFFGPLVDILSVRQDASAVAMANPRDIALVVDLSGSMNDDAEPCWATSALNSEYAPSGYGDVGTNMLRDLFEDLGFGSFPGVVEFIGQPAGVAANRYAYAQLTADGGPLTRPWIPSRYRILPSDSETDRKRKAYSAIIDYQLRRIMPAARPVPSSSVSYDYWERYLDYIIEPVNLSSQGRGVLPPSQSRSRITGFNNPNRTSFPSLSSTAVRWWRGRIGYLTYVQFMTDFGRNLRPDGTTYSQLSTKNANCPYHSEMTLGGVFDFPPRTQPVHASRRALIAAIDVIRQRNDKIGEYAQRDWVSLITFDMLSEGGPVVAQSLTGDYTSAMRACTTLQACGDNVLSTATEEGIKTARSHIAAKSEGGQGRTMADKVIVLLTDGAPNLYTTFPTEIDQYMKENTSDDYYGNSLYWFDAPLMQSHQLEQQGWNVFPVSIGLGSNYDFMDRMARMGGTANDDGLSARGAESPVDYEDRLVEIFEKIIDSPKVRLVQ